METQQKAIPPTSSSVSASSQNKRSRVLYRTPGRVFGNSHEQPDLTKTRGYAYELLKLANMLQTSDKRKVSIWWKSRAAEIKQELRIIRNNNKSTKIRTHYTIRCKFHIDDHYFLLVFFIF